MAIGTLFGGSAESIGLYGNSAGNSVNPTVVNQTYFEWFIFTTSAGTPATPTGGTWDFTTNTGTAPSGWSSFISGVPLNSLWFSVAFIDSRNPTATIAWTSPGLISSQSVYATAYADVFTGNGSTTAWTLTQDPVVVNNTDVSINGVTQIPGTDYTLSSTTLTTTTAAPLGASILVKYRQALPLSYYGAASNVQFTPVGTLTSTNVQSAIAEVLTDYALQTGAASIGFTPVGAIAATNVQSAIAEVVTDLALSSGSSTVGYIQTGTGATATTVQAKLRESVSVLDFGADPTGVADSTTAFTNAQGSGSVQVYIPAGTYKLNGLRIKNGVRLVGAGKSVVTINQAVAGTAAINCTSDVTVGQLKNVELSGFTVVGATSATVAAILVAAYGAYAIWNSTFDYSAKNTYRALEIQSATANNVFDSKFTVQSEGTSSTAVLANGGVYNLFDLFLTQCASYSLVETGAFNCTFVKLVSDNCWTSSGQNTVFINPTVEEIYSASAPTSIVISLTGFNQTLIGPTVILNAGNSAKVTYVAVPATETSIQDPRFLCVVTNPFYEFNGIWTLLGPGQSNCTNKIETIYDGSGGTKNLRNVTFVGNCSSFTLQSVPHGGKNVQYLAPTTSFNFTALNNTDAVIFDFTGTIATANVNLGRTGLPLVNNQVMSFYSGGIITALNLACPAGANVTLLPTTMAAGSKFNAVYYSTNNKWYPI